MFWLLTLSCQSLQHVQHIVDAQRFVENVQGEPEGKINLYYAVDFCDFFKFLFMFNTVFSHIIYYFYNKGKDYFKTIISEAPSLETPPSLEALLSCLIFFYLNKIFHFTHK
jgi:hypothetical protein